MKLHDSIGIDGTVFIADGDRIVWTGDNIPDQIVEDYVAVEEADAAMGRLTDAKAMDAIVAVLTGTEWNADTFDAIAAIVRHTGRSISDLHDVTGE